MKRTRRQKTDALDFSSPTEMMVKREKEKARRLRKTTWWQRKRDEGFCHYCKQEFAPDLLTMDHIIPLSRGGKSTEGNLAPACKECNTEKNTTTPVETILKQWQEQRTNTNPSSPTGEE